VQSYCNWHYYELRQFPFVKINTDKATMGSTYVERLEDTQRDLARYFDKSTTTVRHNFNWFEKEYGRPAITYCLASFDAYPLTSTFIAIFSSLSILPVISFLGFSLFYIALITFVAFVLSIMVIAAVESIFITILLIALTSLLCLTAFLTPLAISAYLTFRFIVHVHSDGRAGASGWAVETKRRFIRPGSGMKLGEHTEGSEVSTVSASAVIIDGREDHRGSGLVKVEGE